jgi:hypothetical protein
MIKTGNKITISKSFLGAGQIRKKAPGKSFITRGIKGLKITMEYATDCITNGIIVVFSGRKHCFQTGMLLNFGSDKIQAYYHLTGLTN